MNKEKPILIVDDSKFVRKTLRNKLEALNFKIVGEAGDGDVAVDLYKELHPDLVLMDIIMPRKSGLEALKEIHCFDNKCKIIIISSILQKKIIEEALQLGAIYYLIKPFEMDTLEDKLIKLFR